MNEPIKGRPAFPGSERVEPVDAPGLRTRQQARAAALARHPGHLRAAAKRRLPRAILDYLEGGSNDEVTLRANRTDLEALRLNQRVFEHAPSRNMRTTLFGQHATIPVALAPIGLAGVFYPRGEIHAARAAHAFGVPYCLSTLSSCAMEDVATASRTPFLFQLYMFKDRGVNANLMQRADQLRCPALVLTLDTCVQGRRNRDLDNGLVVPLKVRPRHVVRIATRLRWLVGFLRNRPTLGNLTAYAAGGSDLATVSAWADRHYKGAVTAADLEWVRQTWPRKLVVKGILDPEDAKLAVKLGADAIVVSNHGGRQLDGANTAARALPAIREAVGDGVELIYDGGIRSGLDVLKALGLGAQGCLIGRAHLYGLAAHGEAGVAAALKMMAQELDEGMALAGVADVNALPRGLVLKPV
ncbi:MAG: alpha-hydroxy acid oxidase [Methyloceanibacter sp.]|uniref:alpha-hydroxy acid oxidase n=1 Tax=Methyloceanibacter sp. TaxID=1965321 RepID=UPI003D6CABFE